MSTSDVFGRTLCDADYMLRSPYHLAFFHLIELGSRDLADRASFRRCIAFMYITTD